MKDNVQVLLIQLVGFVLVVGAVALVELTGLKDIPVARDTILTSVAFIVGKLGFQALPPVQREADK